MMPTERWSDIGMDTASLSGPLGAKLRSIHAAGFRRVMISARDLAEHPGGMAAAIAEVRGSGLSVTALQALRDFEGLDGALRAYKLEIAKALVETCAALEAPILVALSSSIAHSSQDRDVVARDLRRLAMLAWPRGISVAYVPASWGHAVSDMHGALDVVARAGMPNLGIGIDSFHAAASHSALDELEAVFPETVLLVQLSDFMVAELRTDRDRRDEGEHHRVFPGEGLHSAQIAELVRRLTDLGYRGSYNLEVFNDDYRQIDPATVARRAAASARWLAEDILGRARPAWAES
jgi:sugar phosphate isomerase/epimerase